MLKFILLVISDRSKIETCVSQKEYQLTHVPKKIKRWTGFLHDYMRCLELSPGEHRSSLSLDSTFFVDFILKQLFLDWSQWLYSSSLTTSVEKHLFPSSFSKSTGLIGLA